MSKIIQVAAWGVGGAAVGTVITQLPGVLPWVGIGVVMVLAIWKFVCIEWAYRQRMRILRDEGLLAYSLLPSYDAHIWRLFTLRKVV